MSRHLVLERNAFGVVLLEPSFSGILIGGHPEVILVADLLARIDVDQHGHWSLSRLVRRNLLYFHENHARNGAGEQASHGRAWSNSEARLSLCIDLNNAWHRDGNRNAERSKLVNFRAAVSLALNHQFDR
jgi:hypothetical protein